MIFRDCIRIVCPYSVLRTISYKALSGPCCWFKANTRAARKICMYVCMYVRTYVCLHVRMYLCMYLCVCVYVHIWGGAGGFPNLGGTFWGVPITRIMVCWRLDWASPI